MILWLLDEFLLNMPHNCMKFTSFASYRNTLRKKVKFWPKIKILLALSIKNWGFQLKRAGGGSWDKEMHKNRSVDRVDHWPGGRSVEEPVDRFLGAKNLKSLPRLSFSPISSGSSTFVSFQLSSRDFWRHYSFLRGTDWILEAKVWDLGPRASHLADFLLSPRVKACVSVFPCLRALRCVCIPLFSFVYFISAFHMAPRRESAASRAQGKHPVEPSQPDQFEARRKARYDTVLFGSVEDYQRYKQKFA